MGAGWKFGKDLENEPRDHISAPWTTPAQVMASFSERLGYERISKYLVMREAIRWQYIRDGDDLPSEKWYKSSSGVTMDINVSFPLGQPVVGGGDVQT